MSRKGHGLQGLLAWCSVFFMSTSSHTRSYYECKEANISQHDTVYFLTHGRICAACEVSESIELHHLLGSELWKSKDEKSIPLCTTCHAEYHDVNEFPAHISIKEFLAAKGASKEGKRLCSKYQALLVPMLKENREEIDELRWRLNGRKEDEDEYHSFVAGKHLSVPYLFAKEVMEREKSYYTHTEAFANANGMKESRDEEKSRELLYSFKYRWVEEEIKSLLRLRGRQLSEIEKIK